MKTRYRKQLEERWKFVNELIEKGSARYRVDEVTGPWRSGLTILNCNCIRKPRGSEDTGSKR
jgi:hypothetical protein